MQKKAPHGKEVFVGLVRNSETNIAVMFSLGGIFLDILKDVSYRSAPVSKEEALKMMREIKSYSILDSNGKSDIGAIANVIAKVSKLGVEKSEIAEMEINPLFVYERGAIAAEAKMILNI